MSASLASLLIKLGVDASGVSKGMGDAERAIGAGSDKAMSRWKKAGVVVAGAAAVMTRGVSRVEDAEAQFQASTGASAAEAEHFGKVINATSGSSLVSMDNISRSAIGIRSDMGLVGDAADAQLQRFVAYERATGQGAESVQAFDDIQDAWNVTSADTQAIMDTLIAGQHKYGGVIAESQSALTDLAPVLKGLGMDWREGTALINAANEAGVDASGMAAGLGKALKTVKSPEEFKVMVADIAATEDAFERDQKAIALFGKSGAKMGDVIRATGGDLSKFGFTTDEVAGKTDAAKDALDGTWGSKFKLLMKGAGAAITGFGMNFGSALTGIGAAISGASSLGLGKLFTGEKGLLKRFAGIGRGAANAFKGGFGKLTGLFSGITGAVTGSGAWEKAGSLAGSKFGSALKIAGAAALALLALDMAQQLDKVKAENVATVKNIDAGMDKFLATMPSKAEVEAKLASLNAIPASLDGVKGAIMSVGDLGKGNVLGSVFDGLFGASPAQVLDNQKKDLERYLAGIPPVVAAVAPPAAAAAVVVAKKVSTALGTIDIDAAKEALAAGTATIAGAITSGLGAAVSAAQAGMDLVNSALQKPPKLVSYKARLAQYKQAITATMKNLRAAVRANDPVQAAFQEQQLFELTGAYNTFKGQTTKTWSEIVADAKAAGIDLSGVEAETRGQTRKTATAAQRAANKIADAKTAEAAIVSARAADERAATDAAAAAAKVGAADYAASAASITGAAATIPPALAAVVPGVQSSFASMVAAAVGLLQKLWGISAWQAPSITLGASTPNQREGRAGGGSVLANRAYTVGEHGAERLQMGSQSGRITAHMAAMGGGAAGGDVHLHIGTLVANDAGLDELERRMAKRLRLKRRDRRLVGDMA